METILFYVKNTQEALFAANAICSDIKALPDEDQHKLYLRKWPFHAMMIAPYERKGTELVQLDKELLIFPAYREEDLEKLERGKNLVLFKNAMYIVGDNETSIKRRSNIINWLLDKEDLIVIPTENDQQIETEKFPEGENDQNS